MLETSSLDFFKDIRVSFQFRECYLKHLYTINICCIFFKRYCKSGDVRWSTMYYKTMIYIFTLFKIIKLDWNTLYVIWPVLLEFYRQCQPHCKIMTKKKKMINWASFSNSVKRQIVTVFLAFVRFLKKKINFVLSICTHLFCCIHFTWSNRLLHTCMYRVDLKKTTIS